jgi:hypothetical protein
MRQLPASQPRGPSHTKAVYLICPPSQTMIGFSGSISSTPFAASQS